MSAVWRTVSIGDVCDLVTGGTPASSKPEYYRDGDIPWLVSGDIHRVQIKACEGRITRLGMENSNARWLAVDSVIIALNGQGRTRGTVALLRMKATCNQSLVSIAPKDSDELIPEFLFWNLHSRYEEIRRITGDDGNERRGLNMGLIRNIRFPLPRIEEQRRIVAMLNEAVSAIAIATGNVEKNLADARELFQASLVRALEPENVDDSGAAAGAAWDEVTLGELCHIARGGSPRPIKSFLTSAPDGINWIKIGDATAGDGKYISTTKEKIRPEGLKMSRLVRPGDLLLSNSMSFGRPYIMRTTGCIHDGWLVLSDKSNRFDPDYLYYFLSSDAAYRQFDALAAGSTVRNLNTDLVKTVTVVLPPLAVQRRLVERLDDLAAGLDHFRKAQQNKLAELAALKRSILEHAFSGRLAAREPLAA